MLKNPKKITYQKEESERNSCFIICYGTESTFSIVWDPNMFFPIWEVISFPISCRLIEVLEPILD